MDDISLEPTKEVIPELDILRSLQNNMFCDIVLQNVGLIVLGQVMRNNPELNKAEHYADVDFNKLDTIDIQQYRIQAKNIWEGAISALLPRIPQIVEETTRQVKKIIMDSYNYTMVAGTMRMPVTFGNEHDTRITCRLIWTEIKDGK